MKKFDKKGMDTTKLKQEWDKFYKENKSPKDMPSRCPKCGSNAVFSCPGGSCMRPQQGIWWICEDCLHEW